MMLSLKKYMISVLAPSMRSPSGITGWIARQLMRTANPVSTEIGIRRLDLKSTDVFVELGAGEGAGLKTILKMNDEKKDDTGNHPPHSHRSIPSRIVLVEISNDFRNELFRLVHKHKFPSSSPSSLAPTLMTDIVEIHGTDCIDMSSFLQSGSVDKLFAMNVVYFLHPLPEYLQELHRVLKPGGVIVLGCKFEAVPKDSNVFINVDEESVTKAMIDAGFEVSTEMVEVSPTEVIQNYLEIKGIKR